MAAIPEEHINDDRPAIKANSPSSDTLNKR